MTADRGPLEKRRCVPCEGGAKPMSREEARSLLSQVEGWEIDSSWGHPELVKDFHFPNFVEAVDFVNRITPVAEEEGHHPDLRVQWGLVQVSLWTHAAGGLTENDFILAAKLDRV